MLGIEKQKRQNENILETKMTSMVMKNKHENTYVSFIFTKIRKIKKNIIILNAADDIINNYQPNGKTILYELCETCNAIIPPDTTTNNNQQQGETTKREEEHYNKIKKLLVQDTIDVNKVDKMNGMTPLHIAIQQGFDRNVQLLLQTNKINVNKMVEKGKEKGETALTIACAGPTSVANSNIIKLLLNTPLIDFNQSNDNGETPFFILCCMNKLNELKLLIEESSSLNVNVNGSNDALNDVNDMVPLKFNQIDQYQTTPFLAGCRNNSYDVIEYLLHHHLNDIHDSLEQTNCYGHTPLTRAKTFEYNKLIDLLIRFGIAK